MSQDIELTQLLKLLEKQLENLPDVRKRSNNQKYEVKDAVLAAFSVFFTQSSSFLEYQRIMRNNKGKDNAQSLFKIETIPCDNQIRNLLDPLPATTIFKVFEPIYKILDKQGIIKEYRHLNEDILIALDGTEYFSSKKLNCPHCNSRNHRNGTTTYFHSAVLPTIVSPKQKQVISLAPIFIRKQDGHGQNHLCEVLLSLNLLAFLFHTVLDLVNSLYQQIRELLATRQTFFNDLRALLRYLWFDSWQSLFTFMLTEGGSYPPCNSS